MVLFSASRLPLSALKPSRHPSLFPKSPLPQIPVPKFLPPKIPELSLSLSASRHGSLCRCGKSFGPSSFKGEKEGSSRIFIKGMSTSTTEGFLAKEFSCFGPVSRGSPLQNARPE